MNHSESILGTLKYLDDISSRTARSEVREENPSVGNFVNQTIIEQNVKSNRAQEKKIKVLKKDPIAVAEPHLKQFASMLSEELANVKRLQQEELERIRAEEIERVRLEEAKKLRLEIARENIRLEKEEADRQAQAERQKLEQQSLVENRVEEPKTEVHQIKEYVDKTYQKPAVSESLLTFSENKKKKQNLKEQTDFITFEDLNKHYTDFLKKINTQLSSLGGGGEVLMRRLDDVDMSTIEDGYFVSFDAASNKFIGQQAAPGLETIIEGGTF